MIEARDDDWRFFAWLLPGFLISFGLLSMLSIGLSFLLLGVGALLVLAWRGSAWPADLGFIAGVGATCLMIAAIAAVSGDDPPGVWGLVGVALVAASAGAFWQLRHRPPT